MILNSRQSFNCPFKVGENGRRIVLGKYSPSTDSLALLTNTENFKDKNTLKDVINTKDPLEKSIQYHEFFGHVRLTKQSSFWTNIFFMNIYSFLGMGRIMSLVEMGLADEKKERIRKDLRDLITFEYTKIFMHNQWRQLQETVANCYLLKVQSKTQDSEQKKIIDSLVWKQNAKNKSIYKMTKECHRIMNEIGYDKGWNLIEWMSLAASSPEYLKKNKKFKNYDELKEEKKQNFDKGYELGKKDFYSIDPTGRFVELLLVIGRNLDIIKKSFKRGVNEGELVTSAIRFCGHKFQNIKDNLKMVEERMKIISEKDGIIKSESRRSWHLEASKFMKIYKDITQQPLPIYWFINDSRTGKITISNHPIARDNDEVFDYLFGNIIKHQFMMSLEKGKDMISCFGNKSGICTKDCKDCYLYPKLKVAKDAFNFASKFSYEELKKDALDTAKWRSRMSS